MQQTLLTLLALLVATLLSFNQKQAGIQNERQVVQGELEQMALGVAAEAMGVIRAQDFDSNLNGSDDVTTEDLTPEEEFSSKGNNDCRAFFPGSGTDCEALEEFHQMDSATISFEFPDPEDFPDSEESFRFKIKNVSVSYVDEDFDDASDQTFQKKVTLEIQDAPSDGSEPRLPSPIRYSEVISYP